MRTNRDCYLDMEVDEKLEIYLTGIKNEGKRAAIPMNEKTGRRPEIKKEGQKPAKTVRGKKLGLPGR